MGFKSALKTIAAVAYRNRAKIETAVGITLVTVGTGIVISKAREATELADELYMKHKDILLKDANEDWASPKERSKAKRDLVLYASKEYTKTYGPGLALELGGLALIAISDITMNKELSAASAVIATYATTLNNIRDRVVADQGEEKWQEYLLGPQFTTVDVLPDGTVIQTTEPLENPNASAGLPPHCFFFDEANPNWEKDPYQNRDFLENHLRWLNERLKAEGFLFENDIRRDLGAPLVKSGWTSGIFAEDKDGNRNYISFGLDAKNQAAQNFRDGIEPTILIQLNVEDNLIDQLRLPLI